MASHALEALTAEPDHFVVMPEGLAVEKFLALGGGLKLGENPLEIVRHLHAVLGDLALALGGPGFVDDKPAVVPESVAQVRSDRLRVGGHVPEKRSHRGDLASNGGVHIGGVLVGGYGEPSQQQPVEHPEGRERITDQIVDALLGFEPELEGRADEKHAHPGGAHEEQRKQQSKLPVGDVVDPIKHGG